MCHNLPLNTSAHPPDPILFSSLNPFVALLKSDIGKMTKEAEEKEGGEEETEPRLD